MPMKALNETYSSIDQIFEGNVHTLRSLLESNHLVKGGAVESISQCDGEGREWEAGIVENNSHQDAGAAIDHECALNSSVKSQSFFCLDDPFTCAGLSSEMRVSRLDSAHVDRLNSVSSVLQNQVREEQTAASRISMELKNRRLLYKELTSKFRTLKANIAEKNEKLVEREIHVSELTKKISLLKKVQSIDEIAFENVKCEEKIISQIIKVLEGISIEKSLRLLQLANERLSAQCLSQKHTIKCLKVVIHNQEENLRDHRKLQAIAKTSDSTNQQAETFESVFKNATQKIDETDLSLFHRIGESVESIDTNFRELESQQMTLLHRTKLQVPDRVNDAMTVPRKDSPHSLFEEFEKSAAETIHSIRREDQNNLRVVDTLLRPLFNRIKAREAHAIETNRIDCFAQQRDECHAQFKALQAEHADLSLANQEVQLRIRRTATESNDLKKEIRLLKKHKKNLQSSAKLVCSERISALERTREFVNSRNTGQSLPIHARPVVNLEHKNTHAHGADREPQTIIFGRIGGDSNHFFPTS
ncbi:hypothetical protein XU18_1526 [Perkinsela sp. CCAP 1560/4]|nr:hypothetical protein XU18_1526 [Perkinsela sp. CCAP 1560/4]|eukprot:KNH07849.1 hypothetical protein XU18_1526 [Perkinsela sp. CCAP 1560/4]